MDVLEQSKCLLVNFTLAPTTFCAKSIFWNDQKSSAASRPHIHKMRLCSRRVKIQCQSAQDTVRPAPAAHTEMENHTAIPACQRAALRTWESCGKSLDKSVIPNSVRDLFYGVFYGNNNRNFYLSNHRGMRNPQHQKKN